MARITGSAAISEQDSGGARLGFAVSDGQAYDPEAAERQWQNLFALFEAALPG